jgi:mycoredoxin
VHRLSCMQESDSVRYARERFCPDVERARAVLQGHGISCTEFDVEADAAALSRMQALTGRTNVPTVVIGSDILVEPTTDQLEAALIRAGVLEPKR